MTVLWADKPEPAPVRFGPIGWGLAFLRAVPVVLVLLSGVFLTLLLRGPELLLHRDDRPWTAAVTQAVCRLSLLIMGLGFTLRGEVLEGGGAVVSNHASWLDILVLNARKRIYFVSKSEVAGWPGIGVLARITGTVFISRRARDAASQKNQFQDRLALGHRLLFFPEGTSTDGLRVLPFKSSLFQAFFAEELRQNMRVQPVSVLYRPADGLPDDYFGWWGDMALGPHLLKVLATPRPGRVEVICHPPLNVRDFADRKALTFACETAVSAPFSPALTGTGGN